MSDIENYRLSHSDNSDVRLVNVALCGILFKRLHTQPGLVTKYKVETAFLLKDGPVVFTGSTNLTGREPAHAMLVIGMWKDQLGEYHFVL